MIPEARSLERIAEALKDISKSLMRIEIRLEEMNEKETIDADYVKVKDSTEDDLR